MPEISKQTAKGPVAILFGRENSGLSNTELQRCHRHVHIPSNSAYSSLNLAMAVQVICYELCQEFMVVPEALNDPAENNAGVRHQQDAVLSPNDDGWDEPPATTGEMERFFVHLEEMLIDIDFHDPAKPRQLMPRLRRLFQRIQPGKMEVNILRGILKSTQVAVGSQCPDKRNSLRVKPVVGKSKISVRKKSKCIEEKKECKVMKPIYLDYSATTPVDPRVAECMANHLTLDGIFGNPASRSHIYGWQADEAIEKARRQVADALGADPREIVWTSGATESDNLAIKGIAERHAEKGKHIITSVTEHKAVLDSCAHLESSGFDITYLKPGSDGLITADLVAGALREDTILVSVMHLNNELGTINDVAAIGGLLQNHQALYHMDAAQSVGKVKIDVNEIKADLVSCCAHKVYGPKGIGALYVRRKPVVVIEAQIHGGGHERGMRSGTLPTHQIVGMGMAFELAVESMSKEQQRLLSLREAFWIKVQSLGSITLNGHPTQRAAGVLNISFAGVEGETLLLGLRGIAVSSGSACTSASVEPSYVLKALGVSDELALSSVRFSFGRFTTGEDVKMAGQLVVDTVTKLRRSSVG